MVKRLLGTTAILAALALPGYASAQSAGAADHIRADQMRASKMIGATVYDRQNQNVGSVNDLVLDKDGKVAGVVVGVGGFLGVGEKNVSVPMNALKLDNNRLTLDRTKNQLQQAGNYQLEDRYTGAGKSAVPVTGGHAGSGTTTAPESMGSRSR